MKLVCDRPELVEALGLGWETEFVVPTRAGRQLGGLPTHYKLDIAYPELMVAVEVDGHSHNTTERKAQDERKTEFLAGLGWTVLRFSNQEVMADTAACARTVLSTTSKLNERTHTESGPQVS